jgi:hypothetical protein
MFGPAGGSSFTKSVRDLISAVQGSDRQDSLYQQASDYFSVCQEQQQKVQELRFKIKQLEEQEADLSSDTDSDLAARINRLARLLKDQLSSQEKQRRNRLAQVILVCEKLLLLCDAVDEQQSLNNSSKILSTILLYQLP